MNMDIHAIGDCLLDERSSRNALRDALQAFALLCEEISGIRPNPSFDAWAGDSLLENGVAISPQAAAHCVLDYQRTVTYIRGIHAAIYQLKERFPATPLDILYAGCGPYATLLLPLLARFRAGELNIHLLDIHSRSLDSAALLIAELGFGGHTVTTIHADACHYSHPHKVHLIIVETMQKSLEQEPQFAITANLAHQLSPGGVFIPQTIRVTLCLANLEREKKARLAAQNRPGEPYAERYPVATVFDLSPERVADQAHNARCPSPGATREPQVTEVAVTSAVIPAVAGVEHLDAALFTHITVFEEYGLDDYECELTLPLKCHGLAPLAGGEALRVSYLLGSYPRFKVERM